MKEINTFIWQGLIKLIKSDIKNIILLKMFSVSNKFCSFELFIHQRIKRKKIISTKILSSQNIPDNQIIFDNQISIFKAISEWSFNTGDWSNGCRKVSFEFVNKLYFNKSK